MKPLVFTLDFRSGIPATVQIVNQVEQHLANGKLRPGDQLPTVRQLASDLRVNFNTVARAYRMLDEAGLISTQQGRGTYILESSGEAQLPRSRTAALETQVEQFLQVLQHQGYQPDEVAECALDALQAWRQSLLNNN